MSVFAEKGRHSTVLGAFEKRRVPQRPGSEKRVPQKPAQEKLRLQGEATDDSARRLGQVEADPVTRFAAAIATAVPSSGMFPFWSYGVAAVALVLAAWVAAGVWVVATDPPKREIVDEGGRTVVARQDRLAPIQTDASMAAESRMTPPARLGDGVAEMATTPKALEAGQEVVAPAPAESVAAQQPAPTENAPIDVAPAAAPAQPIAPAPQLLAPLMAPAPPAAEQVAESQQVVRAPQDSTAEGAQSGPSSATARQAKCLVKVAGRVVFQRGCPVTSSSSTNFSLDLGDKTAVVALDHGETWTATLGGRSLGKVFRDGQQQCWGRKKEVYICAYGS